LGRYRRPDDKLAQDIVATFLVVAGRMWSLGIDDELNDAAEVEGGPVHPLGRHARLPIRRHARLAPRPHSGPAP
jgi:hypothetical protein